MVTTQGHIGDLDPESAVRLGRFDPSALLVLWCLRKLFFPLLWIGLISVVVTGHFQEIQEAESIEELIGVTGSASEFLGTLLSPFAGVVIAVLLRVAVAVLALVLAYPLSHSNLRTDYAHGRRSGSLMRLWWDRLHFTRAYRSLRWTWGVRQVAVERLGETGRRLAWCDPVLRWASMALFIVFLATSLTAE